MKPHCILVILCALSMALPLKAQTDSTSIKSYNEPFIDRMASSRAFDMTYIGVPLVVGGLIVKSEDDHFRNLRDDYMPRFNRHANDYLQFLPAAVMLGMKIGGVEGRSSWGRMLTSDAFSALIMGSVVYSLKQTTHVMRPDGSNDHSFPSGHTAMAFMAATMLSKEYGHKSPWISVGAYSVATATGLMRMANNKHWLSDVLVGAGIGILSTELGYYLADLIFKENGINHYMSAEDFATFCNPSFLQLYMGLNVMPGIYKFDNDVLQFSAGSTVGVEGAYFFNPYFGVGGKSGISNAAVIWNGEAQEQSLDLVSLYAGAYFSYPIASRFMVESKMIAGYVHSSSLDLSGKPVANRNMAGISTGVSLTFRPKPRLDMKLFADYEMLPSLLQSDSRSVGHILTFGGSVGIMF